MKRSASENSSPPVPAKNAKLEGSFHKYFNEAYSNPETKTQLKQKLFDAKPFSYLQITDFIKDESLVNALEKEVPQRPFSLKSNDLYDFYQSEDLNKCEDSESVKQFRELMTDQEFHAWLEDLTDIQGIQGNIDMSAAIYQDGSYLQCHDDKLEGRRIAYIYYLVPEDWSDKMGGELSLFEVERTGVPKAKPAVKIIPKRNSLFIFIVSVDSFHRVEELLTDKGRMTISGWFRGPPKEYPPVARIPEAYPLCNTVDISKENSIDLSKWINPIYLEEESQHQIQEQFEAESQISLHKFLLDEKFQILCNHVESLQSSEWNIQSPPHQRFYLASPLGDNDKTIVGEFYELLRSPQFFALLKKLTDLDLSRYFAELQKFENGFFTLMHDGDSRRLVSALDCFFYIIDPDFEWDEGWGGYSSYNDEDGELLTVTPCGNTLSLVYCDEGTSRFTKFLNYHVPVPLYNVYMLAAEAETETESKN